MSTKSVLFTVDDGGDVQPMRPGYLHYRCIDIGYGVEEDENYGWFTGEQSQGGGYEFQPSTDLGHGPTLYLFPQEVIVFGRIS